MKEESNLLRIRGMQTQKYQVTFLTYKTGQILPMRM